MCTNAKATPINDNDYSCHITAVDLFNQLYEVHITPLIISSLGGRDTYTDTHTDVCTETILRNQVRAVASTCLV